MRPRSSGSSSSRPVSAGSVGSVGSGSELLPPPLQLPEPPPPQGPPGPVVVITVVKDEAGYGMKVSGDNPVFVQGVKPDGAAERAGLRKGDKILKVNGKVVTHSTHLDVVALIRADAQVVLTVQQQKYVPPANGPAAVAPTGTRVIMPSSPPGPTSPVTNMGGRHHGLHHHHVSAPAGLTKNARDSITGPQPVDLEKKRQMETQRKHTYRLMLEDEQRHIEALRYDLAKNNDVRISHELSKAEKRVRTLQDQLLGLEAASTPEFYQTHSQSAYFPVGVSNSPPPLPPCRPRTLSPPSSSPPALPPRNPPVTSPVANDAAGTELLSINEKSLSPTTNRAYYNSSAGHNPTHQRTKSSPDPLGNSTSVTDGRLSTLSGSESVQNLSYGAGRREKSMSSSSWDMDSSRITPPGTPPPPYRGSSIAGSQDIASPIKDENKNGAEEDGGASFPDTSQGSVGFSSNLPYNPIITMEDDESDQETGQMEDHGPFKSLKQLWQHHAHLAVFMNYLLLNRDPSSLLFYLITDLYKEGNAKEMKKWAYEIHSSFLVPGAPLRLNNVDENVAREVDEVLLKESDKEEILRKVFWKPRIKAKEELTEQLAEFRQKRIEGLGTMFGPNDYELEECIHDKSKETKVIEAHLQLDPYVEEFEREIEIRRESDVKRAVLCAAVCTVASKLFNIRPSHLLERVPSFVSKDKSPKIRLLGRSRKITAQGHQLVAHQYYAVTYCNHCGLIIGGIGPQGYQCTSCLLNIHRWCVRILEESCAGPLIKKDKGNDRISKLMERIRPEREARRKPSHLNASHMEKMKKNSEERDELGGLFNFEGNACGDRSAPAAASSGAAAASSSSRRSATAGDSALNEERSDTTMDHNHLDAGSAPLQPPLPAISGSRKPSASINRSESYKERAQKRQLRERRKTSDPNLSKSTDVDADGTGLQFNNNSGSSSNSTQSLSLDSPSNSLEMVTGVASRVPEPPPPPPLLGVSSGNGGPDIVWDSDMEAEPDPSDWTRLVSEAELKQLSPKEKKRQEVINELFHTERSHVRALKILDQVFYRPLVDILPPDQLSLLFPNLSKMLEIHSGFNKKMKARRRETPLIGDISDMLLDMFDGAAGEDFQQEAAIFCAKQQIALEGLKERRRKDQKLNNFLTEAEGNPLCRRLQLKDIIPTGMLRLTKYPLLFENLVKLCEPGSTERAGVQRALDRSKEILNHVNQAVREAEDLYRLAEIRRRLDRTSFDKTEHPISTEFKHLELTRQKLVHEGALSWRQSKGQKAMELHVLLLEDFILLLQKQDDKFVLKFHSVTSGAQDSKQVYSPLIKYTTVLVRPVATDKRAFFLVNTSGAHIYELVALSTSEQKTWFRHITEAADSYKMREARAKRPDRTDLIPSAIPISPADTVGSVGSEDKESNESSTDQVAGANSNSSLAAPESTDSGFQESNADAGPSPSSALPSDSSPEDQAKKTGSSPGLLRRTSSGRSSSSCDITRPQQRLVEEAPLIQPSEVVVCRRDVLLAEPVLTPIERLRREDEAITQALNRKQEIVAELLHISPDQFETIADLACEQNPEKETAELVLACYYQATRLTNLLNESLRVSEEEAVSAGACPSSPRPGRHRGACGPAGRQVPVVATHLLQDISDALNTHITQMMRVTKERDEERELLRRETQRLREQVHAMHEQRRTGSAKPKRRATATGLSSTSFLPLAPDLSTSEYKSTENVDTITDHPPDTEPSQEEFVDALCGEGEGSTIPQDGDAVQNSAY